VQYKITHVVVVIFQKRTLLCMNIFVLQQKTQKMQKWASKIN
jgi:hypothetical protein